MKPCNITKSGGAIGSQPTTCRHLLIWRHAGGPLLNNRRLSYFQIQGFLFSLVTIPLKRPRWGYAQLYPMVTARSCLEALALSCWWRVSVSDHIDQQSFLDCMGAMVPWLCPWHGAMVFRSPLPARPAANAGTPPFVQRTTTQLSSHQWTEKGRSTSSTEAAAWETRGVSFLRIHRVAERANHLSFIDGGLETPDWDIIAVARRSARLGFSR